MKIIITGATGFIGRNLAEDLYGNGIEIIATGRSPEIGNELKKEGIHFMEADIRNPSQVAAAFCPADAVIHCAGKTGDWGRFNDFFETNVTGTQNVILACKTHNIQNIIFISSPSVYFTGKDRFNILESDPVPEKQFAYGKTKLLAEATLLNLAHEGFKSIILRPRAVYGRYDNTIVPRILKMSEKKNFPLINNGKAMVDITYVGNLAAAVRNCLFAPEGAWNEVYNISNNDPISVREWFGLILKIFNRPFKPKNIPESVAKVIAGMMEMLSLLPFGNKTPSMTRFSVGYIARSMTMSIEKAALRLNYFPATGNYQGFENYKTWLE
ncbi:MAG: hypothetical protein A2277_10135 [Desulfobacterales bacterium RIFOXYA12_FULL_46_15]|nr:MAG: hypothetical protein A2097_11560 [Desulfobacula sp. GWF2_41_7]OGR23227.1 MAG: hypothetical protein A2277_10135 [Desulfobacterales bacterium RIFOXYA12_FULL_46_15]